MECKRWEGELACGGARVARVEDFIASLSLFRSPVDGMSDKAGKSPAADGEEKAGEHVGSLPRPPLREAWWRPWGAG